jgi:membrane protease YdiL (CAAX protease family)
MNDGPVEPQAVRVGPWGLPATIGFALLVGAVYMLLQFAVLVILVGIGGHPKGGAAGAHGMASLRNYGDVLTFGLLGSAIGAGTLLLLIVRARRGLAAGDYLAWRRISFPAIAFWLGTLVLYVLAWEFLASFFGREQIPGFMRSAYTSASFIPLLWIAIIFVAPLFEELFFRGFLFAGIAASRLGATGAVILTAGLWAGLHMQYDLYDMTSVFLLGLLFGMARLRSGSLWPSLSMHMLANLVATVETAAKLMR